MSWSICHKMGLGEVKPTFICLQIANRSFPYSKGIIEDVIVKADKFYFLVDFVILNMDEDTRMSIIL